MDRSRGRRDFRLLWVGETVSQLGSTVTLVALPLVAVTQLHVGTLAVGVLAAAGWLPTLLISLPAGAWVDRRPRRPVMLTCDAVSLLLFASVPVAAALGLLAFWHLLVVAFLGGAARVLFSLAYGVYLPALVAPEDLSAGNGAVQAGARAAEMGGRGLGGVLAQLLGPATSLLADAASFVVSAVCLLSIRTVEPAPDRPRRATSLRVEIVEGLRFVLGDPWLRVLVGFVAVANLTLTGFFTLEVVFLVRDVGVAPAVIGGLVAASSAGGIVGASVATRIGRRFGTARGMLGTVVVTFPLGLLVPLTTRGAGLAFLVVGFLGVGAGVGVLGVTTTSFWQTYCPRELLGRIIAALRFLAQGAVPVGALLAGILGDSIGDRATLAILAAVLVVAGVLIVGSRLRRYRDLPAVAGPLPARSSTPTADVGHGAGVSTRDVVETLLRHLAADDPAGAASLYAAEVDWALDWPAGPAADAVGWIRHRGDRSAVEQHYRDLAAGNAAADRPTTVDAVLVDGEHAVVLGVLRHVVVATGRPYESRLALHLTVVDGEIVRHHVYEDSLAVALAAGAVAPVP